MTFGIILSPPEFARGGAADELGVEISLQSWITHGHFICADDAESTSIIEPGDGWVMVQWPAAQWPKGVRDNEEIAVVANGTTFWARRKGERANGWKWCGHFAFATMAVGSKANIRRAREAFWLQSDPSRFGLRLDHVGFVCTVDRVPRFLELLKEAVKILIGDPEDGGTAIGLVRYCGRFADFESIATPEFVHSTAERSKMPTLDGKLAYGLISATNRSLVEPLDFLAWKASGACYALRRAVWVEAMHEWVGDMNTANAVAS